MALPGWVIFRSQSYWLWFSKLIDALQCLVPNEGVSTLLFVLCFLWGSASPHPVPRDRNLFPPV